MSTYNWGYNPLTKWDEPTSIDIAYFIDDPMQNGGLPLPKFR